MDEWFGPDDEQMERDLDNTIMPQTKPQTLTLTEEYDRDAMQELLAKASNGVVYVEGREGMQRIDLSQYLGPSLQNTGKVTVSYELKSGVGVGRYYSNTGHQPFPSALRAHLTHCLYYDVDIKNAQPTLLLQLCRKLSIDAPNLQRYVENREELLKEAELMTTPNCTRDEAKNLFIVVLFGGSVRTWAKNKTLNPDASLCPFINALATEVHGIANRTFKQLQRLRSLIHKKRKADEKLADPKMRFLSIVIQTIECECLLSIRRTLDSLGWSMDSLIFDGGLVRRRTDREFGSNELETCEVMVFEDTGYSIRLALKPLICTELPVATLPVTDKAALETLHQLAGGDWKTVDGVIYVYRDGIWSPGETAFYDLVMRHCGVLGPKYGQMLKHIRDVMQLAKTKNVFDDTWTKQLNCLDPGLVPFANGIFDVKTCTRREYERSDLLTYKFDFDAPEPGEDVDAEIADVRSILHRLFPDKRLHSEVVTRVAESIFSGRNTHKYFVQLYGEGNNGKTTLMRILQTAFPKWVQMPSVEHLVVHGGPRDANAPQPWLVEVMGARILGFEEPSRGVKFDGALLKLLRGNGVVTGRALYKGNVSYTPSFTLWIAANDLIEIDPMDEAVLNSFHSFRMPSYFEERKGEAPLGTPYVFQKIPNIEERFKGRAHKLALLSVLRDYYLEYERGGLRPLESEYSLARIYKEENPRIREIFDSCIEEDDTSRIAASRVFQVMQANGYKESKHKLTITMELWFKKHAFVKVTKPNNVRTWIGLRAINEGFF